MQKNGNINFQKPTCFFNEWSLVKSSKEPLISKSKSYLFTISEYTCVLTPKLALTLAFLPSDSPLWHLIPKAHTQHEKAEGTTSGLMAACHYMEAPKKETIAWTALNNSE